MAKQPDTHSSIPPSSPHEDDIKPSQVPAMSGFPPSPNGDMQMFPIMYPAFIPNLNPHPKEEHMNRGAGLYAVPVLPYMGPVSGLPSNTLIPLTYSTPTRPYPSEAGAAGMENEQAEQQQLQHPGPQRQVVVRRFQIAIQLDLLLILKLAAVIFLFNQDGSRQRLALLVFAAFLVYLYQTGALAPVIRWLSQGMRRAAAPPQPPRPAARADNVPAAPRQENEGAVVAEGPPGAENTDDGDQVAENENLEAVEGNDGGNRWWGIVKEVQMIVFGFITSLLPGFHHVD